MSWWIAGAAAVGALADRKKPLRGAAMGAGLMATGGAAAGAFGGAAAGGAGAAAGGAGAAGATGAAGAAGASTAAAGSTAAGGGLLGGATATPATTAPTGFSGLLNSANAAATKYKPIMDAAQVGISTAGLLNQPQQQEMAAPPPQMATGGAQTLAQVANQGAPVGTGADAIARRRALLRGGV